VSDPVAEQRRSRCACGAETDTLLKMACSKAERSAATETYAVVTHTRSLKTLYRTHPPRAPRRAPPLARPQGAWAPRRTRSGVGCVRRYVEADKRLRTKFGKKARLGAPGAGGCKGSVFSDLLVAHFGARRVGTYSHQLDPYEFLAMRALGPDGIFIQVFEIVFLEPHQFEASWTGFDLRHQHPL
jgi:hypothetical protein